MTLLSYKDYPAQLPRPEPVLAFQKALWDKSRNVEGIDIPWGDDIYQRIAIYPAPEPTGAVLAFIHGGRWTSGHKEAMAFMAPGFHAAGITFASLGHRLAPHSYDEGFSDLCGGLACLASNAENFGGDRDRIFLGGHSSGGHYAAQLSVTGDWQAGRGLPRDVIKGCLPISGVYDVSSRADFDDWPPPCLKDGDDGHDKSPKYRVSKTPPPFLITWGDEDYPFLIPQAKEFAHTLAHGGGDVETLEVPSMTHFTVLGDAANPGGSWNRRAVAWIAARS